MKNIIVGLYALGMLAMAQSAEAGSCFRGTAQSGYVSAIGFQNGTQADAEAKGINMIRRSCRGEGTSLNRSSIVIEDSWSERRGTAVSTGLLWFATVYGCCN